MSPSRPPDSSPEERGSGTPDGAPEPRYLVIAQAVRAHGIAGALRCRIITEHPGRFEGLQRVFVGDPPVSYAVRRARLEGGTHGGMVLLSLAGIDTREAADALRGALIRVPFEEAVPLKPGEYYAHQIIGLRVATDAGEDLGRVTEVLTTGANDVYVVHGPRGEVLLPAIRSVVQRIDIPAGTMIVHIIDGLLDR
jgi:16S rRNA processing protein RimM